MSIKEDVLEQLVQEYLLHEGFFVQHNIKFRPSPNHWDFDKETDSNHSDIDVLGLHPLRSGVARVFAVSCKSWQSGFHPSADIRAIEQDKIISGRKRWKAYRELVNEKWSEAFLEKIYEVTGSRQFTYITAVTKVKGDKEIWEKHPAFLESLNGNPIQVLDVETMLSTILPQLSTTMANTSLGRILQLINATGLQLTKQEPRDT